MTQPPLSKRDDTAYDEPDTPPDTDTIGSDTPPADPIDPANPGFFRLPGYTDPYGLTLPIVPTRPPLPLPTVAWAVLDNSGRMQALYQNKPPAHAFPSSWSIRPLTWQDTAS